MKGFDILALDGCLEAINAFIMSLGAQVVNENEQKFDPYKSSFGSTEQ